MPGLLDTCVVIDFPSFEDRLPDDVGVPTIVVAELAWGVLAVPPGAERVERENRLTWARTFFDPYPFDIDAAIAYGRVMAAVQRTGRSPKNRIADLLIAAVAAANELPLYTNNPDDFVGLGQLVEVVAL